MSLLAKYLIDRFYINREGEMSVLASEGFGLGFRRPSSALVSHSSPPMYK